MFVLVCVVGLLCAVQPAVAGTTERVSVASDGTEGNDSCGAPSISADGRFVAFCSYASSLVPDDTNGQLDVFVHDRLAGTTSRVSIASDGTQGNDRSLPPSISANGRFVAFPSSADNLVGGDTNGKHDIFVHDRQMGHTELVSIASEGTLGNGASSSRPSISADGRFVAFYSPASNLVDGDTNGCRDVFVHDRQTGQTTRVSVTSDGTQVGGDSEMCAISASGRFVAFESRSSYLVPGDTNSTDDVFVHDRQTGVTERVSVASDGTQGNSGSCYPSISGDGRFVSFSSYASNLVVGDTNNHRDVFIHDRNTAVTTRVSVASDGTQGESHSECSSISSDGRFVAFESYASNLVGGDPNDGWGYIFVHDRETGETTPASVGYDGALLGNSAVPSVSASGLFVAFDSEDATLVPNDTNQARDIFVHNRGFALTVTTSGNGAGTVEAWPSGGIYLPGTTVTLTAVASPGSSFDHWEGDLAGSASPATILMDDDKTVIAYFAPPRQLTVLSAPIDGAAITGDEPGTTPYAAMRADQQFVTLTAPATMPGGSSRTHHFLYWLVGYEPQPYGDRELQLIMDSDQTAVAVYDWRLPGDVTGDCLVNVLDMIFVRNHARTACSE